MRIRDMFVRDINRKINGVIQVGQNDDTTVQEVDEYVVTGELRRHFAHFFTVYDDAFDHPTNDIGVWISGFFGSGKSHFLKMLSYLLANRQIGGKKVVEWFRPKFDDEGTFLTIERATRVPAETILFNIDVEGFSTKDKTAVLRVFAKMFYNHLGFYGEDLKVARLEQFIDKQGKTGEFRRVFEELHGESWVSARSAFGFFEDDIVETLEKVLGMSHTAAENWFNGSEKAEISISQLVSEIREYVEKKPRDFRLLFMVDEVGQYVGTDRDLLLNLQSLVEEIGSHCGGKVWVVCTGQEALDEIIKVRDNEFSRIQARFKTRLQLSSSAVDEVIQKRLLTKTDAARTVLTDLYERNDSVLKNIFTFTNPLQYLKGYSGPDNFVENYPFVPYQFTLLQKIFSAIRKHGSVGKHYSGAERSMLDGFQIVAQEIEGRDEHALAPLYPFYDSVHTFLDGSVRRVVERCEKAAQAHDRLEPGDEKVLKLLYLIRYVGEEITANLDNITILMADRIDVDKITLRGTIQASLDRLKEQHFIDRRGDTYVFLTDEEQDIAREIANTAVSSGRIVERIGQKIFGDIYPFPKFHYMKYDLPFDKKVDDTLTGAATGGMWLQFITPASDILDTTDFSYTNLSKGGVIVVLANTTYYTSLEKALQINTYVKQRNVGQLPKTVQDIIADQQIEAGHLEDEAKEELEKAIAGARFYVDGEKLTLPSGNAVAKINQAMDYLVDHVYRDLSLIDDNVDSDADILAILSGKIPQVIGKGDSNRDAAAKVEEYLEMQAKRRMPTSMEDIQARYQKVPYGWREIDIAAVMAYLVYNRKVTVRYNGTFLRADDKNLPSLLRKKTLRGRVMVALRQSVSALNLRKARQFVQDYFGKQDFPTDEEHFVEAVVAEFGKQQTHLREDIRARYGGHSYPGLSAVDEALGAVDGILSQQGDAIALVNRLLADEDALLDAKEDMEPVEAFFSGPVDIFDKAVEMETSLRDDLSYIREDRETNAALNEIRRITYQPKSIGQMIRGVPSLNGLMDKVRAGHNKLLEARRAELYEAVRQCLGAIHTVAEPLTKFRDIVQQADSHYTALQDTIAKTRLIARLDGLETQMWSYKDGILSRIAQRKKPESPKPPKDGGQPPVKQKKVRTYYRQALFSPKTLASEADIDAYLAQARRQLVDMLEDCDEIKLN